MARAGEFEIKIMRGGHPIWAEIVIEGRKVGLVNSKDLRDLEYAVQRARIEARDAARNMDPKCVDDY